MKLLSKPLWLLLPAVMAVALASCGQEKKAPVAAKSGGEVLEGSISDGMIPLETVRSQAPLAPRSADDGDGKGSADGAKANRKASPRAGQDDSAGPGPSALPPAESSPNEATPGAE